MMSDNLFGVVLAGIFGAVIGSFENVLILRWHEDAGLTGRSACPECRRTIRPRHLVPILSWLWLRGRCADCGKKIHIQYPLVEAIAVLFALIAAFRHSPMTDFAPFLFEFVVTVGLIVPVVMDLRWKELPVEYLAGLGIFAALFRLGEAMTIGSSLLSVIVQTCIAVLGAAAFFGIQYVLSHGKWIGEGDIWFGAMMGAALGTLVRTGIAIYVAYLIGGIMALVGLLLRLYKRKTRVPFAPALAAGTILALWHGETISRWFMQSMP
jgi:leader peptidase (prepilin peptidase) / N-methyltransferase